MTEPSKTPLHAGMNAEAWREAIKHGYEIPKAQAHELVTVLLDEIDRQKVCISDASSKAAETEEAWILKLVEARNERDEAQAIADISVMELVRSSTVRRPDGWHDAMGEDLEPDLTYAINRGLVERADTGYLRFTEFAWQRGYEESQK